MRKNQLQKRLVKSVLRDSNHIQKSHTEYIEKACLHYFNTIHVKKVTDVNYHNKGGYVKAYHNNGDGRKTLIRDIAKKWKLKEEFMVQMLTNY